MSENWYDKAQICLNGHVANASTVAHPQHDKRFCDKCGERTIDTCPACNAPIKGTYHVPGVVFVGYPGYEPRAYCDSCGKPYPWTERKLQAAREMAGELEGLKEDERRLLESSLDDLVTDSPRTRLAAGRFKRLVAKAGPQAAGIFRELLVNVVSDAARHMLWP